MSTHCPDGLETFAELVEVLSDLADSSARQLRDWTLTSQPSPVKKGTARTSREATEVRFILPTIHIRFVCKYILVEQIVFDSASKPKKKAQPLVALKIEIHLCT